MRCAILRDRVIGDHVGRVLVVLLIAVSLRDLGGGPRLSRPSAASTFCFPLYPGATVDLARRAGWPVLRTLAPLLPGTVPFLSFVAERLATHDLRRRA